MSWKPLKVFQGLQPRRLIRRQAGRRHFRPQVEILETRLSPAVDLLVTGAGDTVALDGVVTLREALQAANTNTTVNEAIHDGSGGTDNIRFDTAGVFGAPAVILLGGTELTITGSVTITGPGAGILTISGNNASRVFNVDDGTELHSEVTLSGLSVIAGNAGSSDGGGIFNREVLRVQNSTLSGNRARFGGGIYNSDIPGFGISAHLTLLNSVLSGNTATSDGGGVSNFGVLGVGSTTLSGNTATGSGGGIANAFHNLTVVNSTLSGNTAARGGAIITSRGDGDLNIVENSTLSGNTALDSGGGIYFEGFSTVVVRNSTLSANTAGGDGGGIYAARDFGGGVSGEIAVLNSTITGNHADNDNNASGLGGGIRVAAGSAGLANTLVADNFRGSAITNRDDANGTINGSSFASSGNLIGVDTGVVNSPEIYNPIRGNQVGTAASPINPRLSLLGDFGGPTRTHRLRVGSPAINAGINALAAGFTDQRGLGFDRVVGGAVDIGAFEVQPNQAPTDIDLSNGSVAENQPRGTFVGAFDTADPNLGDTFNYALVAGAGSTDNASFFIDEVGNLTTAASFNFETQSSYSIRVQSTDEGGLFVEKVFSISVTNVNERPTVANEAVLTAFEDVDAHITDLSVSDPEGDSLTITLAVVQGTLTLGTTTGLTVTGNGSGSVILSGSLDDLNTALGSLSYRSALNYSGLDMLSITASDADFSTPASVETTVKSAAQQAEDLEDYVNALVAASALNEGEGESLTFKLKENNGDSGKVQAFLNAVQALLNAGILTPAQANTLFGPGNILLLSVIRR